MEWRIAVVIPGIHVRAVVEQYLHDIFIASIRCFVQGCTIVIFCIHICSTIDKYLRNFRIVGSVQRGSGIGRCMYVRSIIYQYLRNFCIFCLVKRSNARFRPRIDIRSIGSTVVISVLHIGYLEFQLHRLIYICTVIYKKLCSFTSSIPEEILQGPPRSNNNCATSTFFAYPRADPGYYPSL